MTRKGLIVWAVVCLTGLVCADELQYSAELIFPLEHWHNYGSCIVECPNGDLLVSRVG